MTSRMTVDWLFAAEKGRRIGCRHGHGRGECQGRGHRCIQRARLRASVGRGHQRRSSSSRARDNAREVAGGREGGRARWTGPDETVKGMRSRSGCAGRHRGGAVGPVGPVGQVGQHTWGWLILVLTPQLAHPNCHMFLKMLLRTIWLWFSSPPPPGFTVGSLIGLKDVGGP